MMIHNRVVKRVEHNVTITADDIRAYVTSKLKDRHPSEAPSHARVLIRVPGGGDWSNMDIELGEDVEVIRVCWEESP